MSAAPKSPTPVLDALEKAASVPRFDTLYGNAYSSFLRDVSAVPIVSIDGACNTFGDPGDAFPDAEEKLHDRGVWAEAHTGLVGGIGDTADGDANGYSTGILFEHYRLGAEGRDDPWTETLLSARFCIAGDGVPVIFPYRVVVETRLHGIFTGDVGKEHREHAEWFGLADHERARFGLQPAATASPAQLLQMATTVVPLDGRFFRAIPQAHTPSLNIRLPRYSAVRESGVESLRWAFMATCVEQWDPSGGADLDETISTYLRKADNVLRIGPLIALQVLAQIARARSSSDYLRLLPLPSPYDRGRNAFSLTLQNRTATKP